MIDIDIKPSHVNIEHMNTWLYNQSTLPHKTKVWNESFISTNIVMTQQQHTVYAVTKEGLIRNVSIVAPNKTFKHGYVYIIERYVFRLNEKVKGIPVAMLETVITDSLNIADNMCQLDENGNVVIHRVYPVNIKTIRTNKQVRVNGIILSLTLPNNTMADEYHDDGTVSTNIRIVDNINTGTKYYYKVFKAVKEIYSVYDDALDSGIYLGDNSKPIPLKAHDSIGLHLSKDKAYLDDKVEATLESYKLDIAKLDKEKASITAQQAIELGKAKIIISKLNIEGLLAKMEIDKTKNKVDSYKSIKEATKEVGGIVGTIKKVIDIFV